MKPLSTEGIAVIAFFAAVLLIFAICFIVSLVLTSQKWSARREQKMKYKQHILKTYQPEPVENPHYTNNYASRMRRVYLDSLNLKRRSELNLEKYSDDFKMEFISITDGLYKKFVAIAKLDDAINVDFVKSLINVYTSYVDTNFYHLSVRKEFSYEVFAELYASFTSFKDLKPQAKQNQITDQLNAMIKNLTAIWNSFV